MSTTIQINGSERSIPAGMTVKELLTQMFPDGVRQFGLAVAINLTVVPRSEHETRLVEGGDRVDVLHAVGGG